LTLYFWLSFEFNRGFFGNFHKVLRMKLVQLWFLGLFLIAMLGGCGSSNSVVATIGSDKITLDDFENNYAKNNGGWEKGVSSSTEDRQHFLDLLVKFRLKVEEAKDHGLLHDSSVTGEMDEYRLTVSQSYMLEKELIAPKILEMYNRKLEEIRAAHIFFRLPQNPIPADTLAAYEKAQKVLALLPSVRFDTLARQYSEDPQTASLGGDIGWVIPGRMPSNLEDVAYSLKKGEYSKNLVRSPFGYHILKVLERQPANGAIHINHILKRFSRDLKDSTAVRDSIWQIYSQLKHGADFAEMAKKYSDDPPSKERGGDIGFYEREGLRPDIANYLFGLPLDSISTPYQQPYGYHIFKVTGRRPIAPFSDLEKDLRSQYQQHYYQQDYANYVENLRHKFGITLDSAVEKSIGKSVDSMKTFNTPGWSDTLSSELRGKILFTCAGKPYSIKDFVESVEKSSDSKELSLNPVNINVVVNRSIDAYALKEHAMTAVDRYPELKRLMNEYLDGILLYRIEQDEVWKKVVVNDSLLKVYYDTTKDKYRWPNRVNFAEIFVTSDSAKKAVEWKLSYDEDFLSVAEEYTARPGYRDKLGLWGLQPYDLNELSQKASKMPVDSISDFFQFQSGWSIIKVVAKDSSRVKTFEEAGPELASSYQEQASKTREEEWLDALARKYGVTVNNALLSQAFKKKTLEQQ
jgi:peptidyl-prolyl cis-trans isomerase SurA